MAGERVISVNGYVVCSRCSDALVVEEVANRTSGLCSKCWVAVKGEPALRLSSNGVQFSVKRSGKGVNRPKKLTPARRDKIRLRDKARLLALRELAHRHPVEFANILASERGRLGLEPWTIDAALAAQLVEAGVSHGS